MNLSSVDINYVSFTFVDFLFVANLKKCNMFYYCNQISKGPIGKGDAYEERGPLFRVLLFLLNN